MTLCHVLNNLRMFKLGLSDSLLGQRNFEKEFHHGWDGALCTDQAGLQLTEIL